MREREAYPELYQESAARKTRDKAINILQGRCVGGGTTVNWTSSFRTPRGDACALAGASRRPAVSTPTALEPWFARMEARLGIAPWTVAPNANNAALPRGAREARYRERRRDPPQRARLLEPRLLRPGLPDQCQAVDAGDDDSRGARSRRDAAGRARVQSAS